MWKENERFSGLNGPLTNLEKKKRNEKRRKKIAEASDFGDKLIRLNMIVSHKPNLSVAVG